MTDTITLTGLVATVPFVVSRDDKIPFTSFRLASSQRYFDRRTSEWVAGDTNWYTVTAFRALATNAAASVHKGDRVIVAGRLKVRRWEAGDKSGTSVDVEAESIGHDLAWGTAQYSRSQRENTQGQTEQDQQQAHSEAAGERTDAGVTGGTAEASPAATSGSSGDQFAGAVSETPF